MEDPEFSNALSNLIRMGLVEEVREGDLIGYRITEQGEHTAMLEALDTETVLPN